MPTSRCAHHGNSHAHVQAIVSLDRGTAKARKGLYALSLDLPLPTTAALSAFSAEDQVDDLPIHPLTLSPLSIR